MSQIFDIGLNSSFIVCKEDTTLQKKKRRKINKRYPFFVIQNKNCSDVNKESETYFPIFVYYIENNTGFYLMYHLLISSIRSRRYWQVYNGLQSPVSIFNRGGYRISERAGSR